MKIHCKVIGHELVNKHKRQMVKVKLEGTGVEPFKAEVLVEEEERVKYPFGCAAVVNFDVQQRLPLEK